MTAEFADQLRSLRAQRGLSLRELAARAHCGKSQIYDLETGRRRPTESIARTLNGALLAPAFRALSAGCGQCGRSPDG